MRKSDEASYRIRGPFVLTINTKNMQTEEVKHLPYLDGWRGVAIILVLAAHFTRRYELMSVGGFGVLLFFVLSGHFIGQLLFIKKTPLSTFFVRRISRIIPLTWTYIVAMYVYARFFMPGVYTPSTNELIGTFFFLGAYLPWDISIWKGSWPIGQLWSLNVEEHSYIFLALSSVFISKFKSSNAFKIYFLCVVSLSIVIALLYLFDVIHAGASPWQTHTEVAALGLIAAASLAARPSKNKTWWNSAPWVPIALLILSFLPFIPYHTSLGLSLTASPLCAATAITYSHNFPIPIKKFLSHPILRWFGRVSFSIYLWQQPFFELCHQHAFPAWLGLGLSLTIATASFYFIENPSRKYLNRKWSQFESRTITTDKVAL